MAKVNVQTELGVSPDQVWDLVGGFNTLPDWHPAVEKSVLKNKGEVRELSIVGGGKVIEKLESLDDGERRYSYTIVTAGGLLPVANYRATICVRESEKGTSVVEWSGEFEPAIGANESESIKAIRDLYQTGFDNLNKMLGR